MIGPPVEPRLEQGSKEGICRTLVKEKSHCGAIHPVLVLLSSGIAMSRRYSRVGKVDLLRINPRFFLCSSMLRQACFVCKIPIDKHKQPPYTSTIRKQGLFKSSRGC
jgi:hypothetical protein